MEKPDDMKREAASSGSLREAVSQARLDEAQEIEKGLDQRSTELARLEILQASLKSVFDDIPAGDSRFELALMPSSPARLWIDMFTFVEVGADGELYRLVRNQRSGRKVLVESRDVGVMRGRITEYVARQIVARERELYGLEDMAPFPGMRPRRLRVGLVLAAFIIGILTGVAGLFAVGWSLTQ